MRDEQQDIDLAFALRSLCPEFSWCPKAGGSLWHDCICSALPTELPSGKFAITPLCECVWHKQAHCFRYSMSLITI